MGRQTKADAAAPQTRIKCRAQTNISEETTIRKVKCQRPFKNARFDQIRRLIVLQSHLSQEMEEEQRAYQAIN
jgi:hypothetical protein